MNFFSLLKFFWGVLCILGQPYGIGATIRIGREIRCLPYAVFLCAYIQMGIDDIFPLTNEITHELPNKSTQVLKKNVTMRTKLKYFLTNSKKPFFV